MSSGEAMGKQWGEKGYRVKGAEEQCIVVMYSAWKKHKRRKSAGFFVSHQSTKS